MMILGAAFVALICDFLKGNNEQLRELTIELQARREARVVERVERPKPEQVAAPAVPSATAPKVRSAIGKEQKRAVNADALAAMERGAALAGSGKRPRSAPASPPIAPPKPEGILTQQEVAKSTITTAARRDWDRSSAATRRPKFNRLPALRQPTKVCSPRLSPPPIPPPPRRRPSRFYPRASRTDSY